MELWVGSNTMIFSPLYIAASHTAHVRYIFVCVYIYIVSCHICITFVNMLPSIFFLA